MTKSQNIQITYAYPRAKTLSITKLGESQVGF